MSKFYSEIEKERSTKIKRVFAAKRILEWDWKQFNYWYYTKMRFTGKIVDQHINELRNIVLGLESELQSKEIKEADEPVFED